MGKKKKFWNKNYDNYGKKLGKEDPPEVIPEYDPKKPFTLITRKDWGAEPGFAHRPLHTPVRKLRIIYDMNMDRCDATKTLKKLVFGIQRRHIHWGWPDINVNFIVAGDGNVYEGLGWTHKIIRLPHHSVETANTVAIGCMGRYNRQTVPRRFKKALDEFIKKSVEDGPLDMPFGEVTRFEWGALESKAKTELWNPVTKILIIYGTETKACTTKQECMKLVRELQVTDIYARRMPDLNYNFLIGGDGNVYEGRGFSKKPTIIHDYIPNSMIVAYIGDWAVEDPPQMMEDIFSEFCRLYVKEGKINPMWESYFIRGY